MMTRLKRMKSNKSGIFLLPIDVLTSVLNLIPAQDLLPLRGVCRMWRELISSRGFSEQYLALDRSRIRFMAFVRDRYLYSLELSDNNNFEPICYNEVDLLYLSFLRDIGSQIVSVVSCDGLLLLQIRRSLVRRFVICNPVTKSYRLLPEFGGSISRYGNGSGNWTMAYDESVGLHKVFGMIIVMPSQVKCCIYELQGGSSSCGWRYADVTGIQNIENSVARANAFRDGKVHFLVTLSDRGFLVSVNVSTEVCTTSPLFQMPDHCRVTNPRSVHTQLSGSNGAFYFVTPSFELWTLSDFDNPRWVLISRSCSKQTPFLTEKLRPGFRPLVVWEDHGTKWIVHIPSGKYLYMFDRISEEWRKLSLDTIYQKSGSMAMLVPHVPAITPV